MSVDTLISFVRFKINRPFHLRYYYRYIERVQIFYESALLAVKAPGDHPRLNPALLVYYVNTATRKFSAISVTNKTTQEWYTQNSKYGVWTTKNSDFRIARSVNFTRDFTVLSRLLAQVMRSRVSRPRETVFNPRFPPSVYNTEFPRG